MAPRDTGKYTLRARTSLASLEILDESFDSENDIGDEEDDKDSDYDVETDLFAENDDQQQEEDNPVTAASTDDDSSAVTKANVSNAKVIKNNVPPGFDESKWVDGDCNLNWLADFQGDKTFLVDMPQEPDELYFFSLFLTDDVYEQITLQTNKYARQFISKQKEKDNLATNSRFRRWPEEGIKMERIKVFIALSFYFGIVKKNNIKDYWSTNEILCTPFASKVMKRDEFLNIFSFLHLCDNETYIAKGNDGYDPLKKLGVFYETVTNIFADLWRPRQYLSVDEGCIPFKGRVHFKCYNPNKIDKYHIKTFKLVDSTNNYCLKFALYVGQQDDITGYGKTHDLVMSLLEKYLGENYIIFMDNFYSSPYLFHNFELFHTQKNYIDRYIELFLR